MSESGTQIRRWFSSNIGKPLAFAVEQHARAGKFQPFELVMVGKVSERLVIELDHITQIGRGRWNLLVLAELPIPGNKFGKIDAAEYFAFARDRLRVLHSG
jgi:hypothetical protein